RPVDSPLCWGASTLAFSADGRRLASGGSDHAIHLWETASGKECTRLHGHSMADITPSVTSLAFNEDGRRLASGSADSTILVWDMTGRAREGQLRPAKLTEEELKIL